MSILPKSAFIVYLSEEWDHFSNFLNAYSFEGLMEKNKKKSKQTPFTCSNPWIILRWEENAAQILVFVHIFHTAELRSASD